MLHHVGGPPCAWDAAVDQSALAFAPQLTNDDITRIGVCGGHEDAGQELPRMSGRRFKSRGPQVAGLDGTGAF